MISRYIGDRIVQDNITGQPPFPTNLLSGAILNTIEPKSFFIYDGNAWAPVNHFYVGSGISGFTTGITLENQSDISALGDWEDLTTMSTSGDWGTLDSPTSSGDWGSILDSITPGTSIDVKLAEDRRTVAAIRFRRLVSGNSNYDSTVEFWCHDSGALVPRFYIQSGLFLPWLSGKQFLGLPFLPFSGIFTEKLIGKQIQIENGIIPSSGNTLTANSGQLYWSGQKAAIISGNTEDGVLTYNKDYPNVNVESGVKISGQRMELGQVRFASNDIPFDVSSVLHATSGQLYWSGYKAAIISGSTENAVLVYDEGYPNAVAQTGVYVNQGRLAVGLSTLPDNNLQVHGSAPSIGITSLTNTAELSMTNAIQNKCYFVYSGSGLETRVGLANLPTMTVREGDVDISGMIRIRGSDNRAYQNALSTTSGKLYWSGQNVLIHSGFTDGGLITYHPDYPNANVESGVLVSGDRLFVRNSSPTITLDLTAASLSSFDIKIDNADNAFKIVSTEGNDVAPFVIYQGGSNNTLTINGNSSSSVGIRTNDPVSDLDVTRTNIQQNVISGYGIYLKNDSASTNTTNQYSPPISWRGSFRNPTGLNSVTSEFRAYISTSSGTNPLGRGSGALVFEGQTGYNGFNEIIRLDYDAGLKLAPNRTFNSGIVFADHQGGLREASGLSFDTGTNVLKIKTISGNQARYHVGGTLYSMTDFVAAVGDVGDLASFTVPANTLWNFGDRLEMSSHGVFAPSHDGPKRLILEINNTKCIDFDNVARNSSGTWRISASSCRLNTANQVHSSVVLITGRSWSADGTPDQAITNDNEPGYINHTHATVSGLLNADQLIRIRGQSGVQVQSFFINYYPGNGIV